jgi:hypothetical protein
MVEKESTTTLEPNEVMTVWCCRCGAARVLSGDGLALYERESKVVLCRECEAVS